MQLVKITINGKAFEHEVEPRLLLVHYIREKAQLTGTHVGCDTGNCGACTVVYNGKLIKSCLMLAVQADGAEILTIEGMSQQDPEKQKNGLHPIQDAFLEKFGFQCGYCTSGMVLNTHTLLKSNPNPSEHEIRESLEGNLCMCTGYQQIIESIQYAAEKMKASK
ncbi:MAG: (2Fe-2S)-binding protein [Acidobacteria bacterium]|nr:(2Fe-2S)-binding protein [Acidobacteriota bacterium]